MSDNIINFEEKKILKLAYKLSGDKNIALNWYEAYNIECFGGFTPKELVFFGHGDAVIDYLESIDVGPSG